MGYSRKNPNRGGWGYNFLKTPWKFSFFTLLLEISKLKQRSYGNLIPRPKTKTLGKPNYFFLVNLGNSSLLLINDPWKFHMLFLWYPWKIRPPPPSPVSCLDFLWNSSMCFSFIKGQGLLPNNFCHPLPLNR